MLKSEIEVIARRNTNVTESPLWDPAARALHFVDIYGCRIVSLNWEDRSISEIETPEPVGCIGLVDEHRFVAGLKSGLAYVQRRSGETAYIAKINEGPSNRLNDGRCDPTGRYFWVGSMVETLDSEDGHLYRISSDGETTKFVSGLICSNGLAWSPDGNTMYHADSRQKTVWAYDYDTSTGDISNKRIFYIAPTGTGRPDGAAVDCEGCYWIAHYDGWRIVRYDPHGQEVFSLETPVQHPTMCAFAGADLSTLVFTSARGKLSDDQLADQPLAGSVFAVAVDVRGKAEARFR